MKVLSGTARSRLLGLSMLTFVLSSAAPAGAEPYLAVRYGYKCSQCHLNPSGGGKRNAFGNIFTQTELPRHVISSKDIENFLKFGREEDDSGDADSAEEDADDIFSRVSDLTPSSTFYSGYLTDFLSLGGDFRFVNRTTIRGSDDVSTTFDVTEGNLYGSLEFLDGALVGYFDETIAPGGAASREAFMLVRGPSDSYLKAGRMMLPFGLRLQDDAAFIREITGFNYGVQDLGVELGWEPGPFSLSVAASNGTQGSSDDNRDKQFSGVASFIQRHWRVGAQATWNNNPRPRGKRIAVGGFAAANVGRFTLLGEVDFINDELDIATSGGSTEGKLLAYGGLNYYLTKGVNVKLTYDFADPDTSEPNDTFIRLGAGVEYFWTQFTQLRAFYRFRDEAEGSAREDESELFFEFHVFF